MARRRKRRFFSPEFKADTVKLVLEGGRGIAQVARDLDLTETSLREWVRQAQIEEGKGPPGALTEAERAELAQLRRENKRLRMEREILKNRRARLHLLVDQKLPKRIRSAAPEGSGRSLTGALEPVKKHGLGVAADLILATPFGDPV